MRLDEAKTPEDLRVMYAERGRKISERIAEKEARGEVVRAVPLGYRSVREGPGRNFTAIDPVVGPILREALLLHADGRHSLRSLSSWLAA